MATGKVGRNSGYAQGAKAPHGAKTAKGGLRLTNIESAIKMQPNQGCNGRKRQALGFSSPSGEVLGDYFAISREPKPGKATVLLTLMQLMANLNGGMDALRESRRGFRDAANELASNRLKQLPTIGKARSGTSPKTDTSPPKPGTSPGASAVKPQGRLKPGVVKNGDVAPSPMDSVGSMIGTAADAVDSMLAGIFTLGTNRLLADAKSIPDTSVVSPSVDTLAVPESSETERPDKPVRGKRHYHLDGVWHANSNVAHGAVSPQGVLSNIAKRIGLQGGNTVSTQVDFVYTKWLLRRHANLEDTPARFGQFFRDLTEKWNDEVRRNDAGASEVDSYDVAAQLSLKPVTPDAHATPEAKLATLEAADPAALDHIAKVLSPSANRPEGEEAGRAKFADAALRLVGIDPPTLLPTKRDEYRAKVYEQLHEPRAFLERRAELRVCGDQGCGDTSDIRSVVATYLSPLSRRHNELHDQPFLEHLLDSYLERKIGRAATIVLSPEQRAVHALEFFGKAVLNKPDLSGSLPGDRARMAGMTYPNAKEVADAAANTFLDSNLNESNEGMPELKAILKSAYLQALDPFFGQAGLEHVKLGSTEHLLMHLGDEFGNAKGMPCKDARTCYLAGREALSLMDDRQAEIALARVNAKVSGTLDSHLQSSGNAEEFERKLLGDLDKTIAKEIKQLAQNLDVAVQGVDLKNPPTVQSVLNVIAARNQVSATDKVPGLKVCYGLPIPCTYISMNPPVTLATAFTASHTTIVGSEVWEDYGDDIGRIPPESPGTEITREEFPTSVLFPNGNVESIAGAHQEAAKLVEDDIERLGQHALPTFMRTEVENQYPGGKVHDVFVPITGANPKTHKAVILQVEVPGGHILLLDTINDGLGLNLKPIPGSNLNDAKAYAAQHPDQFTDSAHENELRNSGFRTLGGHTHGHGDGLNRLFDALGYENKFRERIAKIQEYFKNGAHERLIDWGWESLGAIGLAGLRGCVEGIKTWANSGHVAAPAGSHEDVLGGADFGPDDSGEEFTTIDRLNTVASCLSMGEAAAPVVKAGVSKAKSSISRFRNTRKPAKLSTSARRDFAESKRNTKQVTKATAVNSVQPSEVGESLKQYGGKAGEYGGAILVHKNQLDAPFIRKAEKKLVTVDTETGITVLRGRKDGKRLATVSGGPGELPQLTKTANRNKDVFVGDIEGQKVLLTKVRVNSHGDTEYQPCNLEGEPLAKASSYLRIEQPDGSKILYSKTLSFKRDGVEIKVDASELKGRIRRFTTEAGEDVSLIEHEGKVYRVVNIRGSQSLVNSTDDDKSLWSACFGVSRSKRMLPQSPNASQTCGVNAASGGNNALPQAQNLSPRLNLPVLKDGYDIPDLTKPELVHSTGPRFVAGSHDVTYPNNFADTDASLLTGNHKYHYDTLLERDRKARPDGKPTNVKSVLLASDFGEIVGSKIKKFDSSSFQIEDGNLKGRTFALGYDSDRHQKISSENNELKLIREKKIGAAVVKAKEDAFIKKMTDKLKVNDFLLYDTSELTDENKDTLYELVSRNLDPEERTRIFYMDKPRVSGYDVNFNKRMISSWNAEFSARLARQEPLFRNAAPIINDDKFFKDNGLKVDAPQYIKSKHQINFLPNGLDKSSWSPDFEDIVRNLDTIDEPATRRLLNRQVGGQRYLQAATDIGEAHAMAIVVDKYNLEVERTICGNPTANGDSQSADYICTEGTPSFKGRTFDLMYTAKDEADVLSINNSFRRDFTNQNDPGKNTKNKIKDHLAKADFVPIMIKGIDPDNLGNLRAAVDSLPDVDRRRVIFIE